MAAPSELSPIQLMLKLVTDREEEAKKKRKKKQRLQIININQDWSTQRHPGGAQVSLARSPARPSRPAGRSSPATQQDDVQGDHHKDYAGQASKEANYANERTHREQPPATNLNKLVAAGEQAADVASSPGRPRNTKRNSPNWTDKNADHRRRAGGAKINEPQRVVDGGSGGGPNDARRQVDVKLAPTGWNQGRNHCFGHQHHHHLHCCRPSASWRPHNVVATADAAAGPNWRRRRADQLDARKRRPRLAVGGTQFSGQMIETRQQQQQQQQRFAVAGPHRSPSEIIAGAARHAQPTADGPFRRAPLKPINETATGRTLAATAAELARFVRQQRESKFNESNESKCESKCFLPSTKTTTTRRSSQTGEHQTASPGGAAKGETTDTKVNGRLIIAAGGGAEEAAIDPSPVCCGQTSGAAKLAPDVGVLKDEQQQGQRHANEMNVRRPGTGNKNKANSMIDYKGECDADDDDDGGGGGDGESLDDSRLCYHRWICAKRHLYDCPGGRPLQPSEDQYDPKLAGGHNTRRANCRHHETKLRGHLFAVGRTPSRGGQQSGEQETSKRRVQKLVSNKKSCPLTSVMLVIRTASLLLLWWLIISQNTDNTRGLVQVASSAATPTGRSNTTTTTTTNIPSLMGSSGRPQMDRPHSSSAASKTKRLARPEVGETAASGGPRHWKRQQEPARKAKFAFWLNLLIKLGEISGSQMESIDHLASKMTDWPDQQRAALFYLELLARASKTTGGGGGGPTSAGSCLRVSLGQLTAPSSVQLKSLEGDDQHQEKHRHDEEHSRGANVDDNDARVELKRRALDERKRLDAQLELLKTVVALDELRPEESSSVSLARPQAWLSSLTSSSASNTASRNSKLAATLGRRHSATRELALKLAVDNANLISRLLFRPPAAAAATTAALESNTDEGPSSSSSSSSKLDASIEFLNQLAGTPRFFRYLLANKVGQLAPRTGALHSAGLIIWDYLADKRPRYLFGQMAQVRPGADNQVALVDLLGHPTASNASDPNGYFREQIGRPKEQPPPSFLLRWLLAEQLGELASLKRRISAANWLRSSRARRANSAPTTEDNKGGDDDDDDHQEEELTFKVEDGSWFWPHFDCGVTNRWLLAYSIPIFSLGSSSDQHIRLRGISFVQLDLTKLAPLIDQCALDEGSSFLANTQQCPLRLTSSQCIQLPTLREDNTDEDDEASPALRPGSYVCQCPAAGQSESRDVAKGDTAEVDVGGGGGGDDGRRRQAELIEAKRKQLGELLLSRATTTTTTNGQQATDSNNSNHLLDQIALEQIDAQYSGNRQLVGTKLLQQRLQRHPGEWSHRPPRLPYFELGAQLEHDLVLDWFAGQPGDPGEPTQAYSPLADWPRQSCCEPAGCLPGSEPTSPGHLRREPPMDWVRPVVLVVQVTCILVTCVLIAILFRVRKSRIIVVSGWLMLETMLVGALMLYASVLVHYFRPTSLTCLLVPWLRELGFSIFYGSILIKLYKILAEFQTRKAHRVCLRDKDQVVYLLAVVLIVVGYMSAWTALMIDGFFVGRRSSHLSAVNSSSTGESPINEALIGGAHEQDNDAARVRHQTAALPTLGAFNYLAHGLSSFGELFSGLLESERQYDAQNDILIYFTRCRKLTWDYVTESSEMALLLFGLHLVYKLRNATGELHKEKLILCGSVSLELLISTLAYLARHALWHRLNSNHLLLLYTVRCQFTVTLTVVLVFGPKLWAIGMSKPSSLFGAFGSSSSSNNRTGGSVRHRCHISCELHDHHLNDATKLHQAMLSNAALEIGSINLADMDPDEIQAELKRVYTQLEVLKTKAMRRDNPHISKRRGGRKPGHRKFSLQAFHARHSSSGDQQQQQQQAGPTATGNKHPEQASLISATSRLPALAELECSSPMGSTQTDAANSGASVAPANRKHVRVDEVIQQYDTSRQQNGSHDDNNEHQRFSSSKREQKSNNYHRHHRQQATGTCGKQTVENKSATSKRHIKLMEVPSTSSGGLDHDDMMAMIESQSSGETSPIEGRKTSVVFSQSSVQQEE